MEKIMGIEDLDVEIVNLMTQLLVVLRKTDYARTKSVILWILMHTTYTSYEMLGLLTEMEWLLLRNWDVLMRMRMEQEVENDGELKR